MSGKVLRGVGLALIALPEPITTPIGLGILAASWAISRHEESRKKARLKYILKDYFHSYRPFGLGMNVDAPAPHVVSHRERQPLFHSDRLPGSDRLTGLGDTAVIYRKDCPEAKVVHHTFDRGSVAKRFDAGGTRRGFEGYWGKQTKLDIAAIRNSLKMAPSLCLS
jgi:hypothetical protein